MRPGRRAGCEGARGGGRNRRSGIAPPVSSSLGWAPPSIPPGATIGAGCPARLVEPGLGAALDTAWCNHRSGLPRPSRRAWAGRRPRYRLVQPSERVAPPVSSSLGWAPPSIPPGATIGAGCPARLVEPGLGAALDTAWCNHRSGLPRPSRRAWAGRRPRYRLVQPSERVAPPVSSSLGWAPPSIPPGATIGAGCPARLVEPGLGAALDTAWCNHRSGIAPPVSSSLGWAPPSIPPGATIGAGRPARLPNHPPATRTTAAAGPALANRATVTRP